MKKIHTYIAKNFLITFFIAFIFSTLLFILSDFFGNLSAILSNSVSLKYVLEYYIYYLPFIIYFSMPVIFALSSLISLGFMSMKNEIIVMRASGLGIFNISLPVILFSILVAFLMFISKEAIVNYGLQKSSFIKHYYFKNKKLDVDWLKMNDFFIKISSIDVPGKTAFNVMVYKVKKNFENISDIYNCKKLKIHKNRADFINCKWFEPKTGKADLLSHFVVNFKGSFYSLLSLSKFKEPSIESLLNNLKTAKNKDYYISMILFRILYPASCIVLTILSLVFVLRITPRKSGFIRNVFLGGVTFLVYIGSFEMVSSMGKLSMINPALTMIIFVFFWLAISMYNLLKLGI